MDLLLSLMKNKTVQQNNKDNHTAEKHSLREEITVDEWHVQKDGSFG